MSAIAPLWLIADLRGCEAEGSGIAFVRAAMRATETMLVADEGNA